MIYHFYDSGAIEPQVIPPQPMPDIKPGDDGSNDEKD